MEAIRERRSRLSGRTLAHQSVVDPEDNCLYTTDVRFEWDPPKAAANIRAHGVSLVEAVTVFDDDFALTRKDPDATDEVRFATLGLSDVGNLLAIVYTYREPEIIRVISAWKANKLYEEGRS